MLKQRSLISENKAKQMIYAFVRYGDHSNRNKTDILNNKQVALWFEQNGYPFNKLIRSTRKWDSFGIPFVENFIHSTFYADIGEGKGKSQIINNATGDVETQIDGSGVLITSDYQAKFESAIKHKRLAIKNTDIEEFYSCLTKAFSSVDSYFLNVSKIYNSTASEKLLDTKENPCSLDDKFKEWVPKITGGAKLNLGKKSWCLFKKHLEIRHNEAIHPKKTSTGINYNDFATLLNEFRDGVAKVFFDLHVLFGDQIKRTLIREVFSPDVYVNKRI